MSETTFTGESGGVADFMRAVADNARLMHTIQAQKVRIAELERERDEAIDKAIRYDLDAAGIAYRESEFRELIELRAEVARLQAAAQRVVDIADKDPFSSVGFVIEHVVPELRAALAQEEEER